MILLQLIAKRLATGNRRCAETLLNALGAWPRYEDTACGDAFPHWKLTAAWVDERASAGTQKHSDPHCQCWFSLSGLRQRARAQALGELLISGETGHENGATSAERLDSKNFFNLF